MHDDATMNRTNWDARAAIHARSAYYTAQFEALRAGGCCLDPVIVGQVGDVAGKTLAHLQCHVGLDTLAWARRGAAVTGLDFSPASVAQAERYRDALGLDARFVCADVLDAGAALAEAYDVVFSSIGVLCWLGDLPRWAAQVAAVLRPGGLFYLADHHPFMHGFESTPDGEGIEPTRSYFDASPTTYSAGATYADDGSGAVVPACVEWAHTVSDVCNALLGAGLALRRMAESPACEFRWFECMEETSPGWFEFPGAMRGRLPTRWTTWWTK